MCANYVNYGNSFVITMSYSVQSHRTN